MSETRELTFVQKRFLVQQLACFETPTAAAKAFKAEFGFEVGLSRVAYYNAATKSAAALADDLRALFHETRKAFLSECDAIPIANKAVQLRALDKALTLAEGRGQIAMVIPLVEAAAKIAGTITNKHSHEVTGKDGGPIQVAHDARDRIFKRLDEIREKRLTGGTAGEPAGAGSGEPAPGAG
jgi:hypothetical protein